MKRPCGVLLCMLMVGSIRATTCSTVMAGNFMDASVWDCSCSPGNCDTLIISHPVTLTADVQLTISALQITTAGSLIGPFEVMLYGELVNDGLIQVLRLYTHLGYDTRNMGTITCDVFVSVSDSTFNEGSINCADSLVNGFYRPFITEGLVNTNVLYALGSYSNTGTTSCSRTTIINCFNGGSMNIQDTLSIGVLLWNDSVIHAAHLITAVSIWNHGEIWVAGLFEHGFQGNADSRLEANSSIRTRDFINSAGSEIRGPGQLCIEGHAENHGVLRGSLVICDLSPEMDVPPYLDVNTGSFWLSVTYCGNSSCAWTHVPEASGNGALRIFPNPARDHIILELTDQKRSVQIVELHDVTGRMVMQLIGPFGERIQLERGSLPNGLYWIRVLDGETHVITGQAVVFAE